MSLIKRHRTVNEILRAELDGEVHALSIQAKTPAQWGASNAVAPSPKCMVRDICPRSTQKVEIKRYNRSMYAVLYFVARAIE